jgi:hypothetical protein
MSRVDTSVFDSLRDDQLINQPEIDKEWESLMVSGPMAVGYMGNLMVLASKRDFPFQAPPGYTYRYIRLNKINLLFLSYLSYRSFLQISKLIWCYSCSSIIRYV